VFPRAFSVVVTALHIPLTLALIGMVVRGAAFVFRAYGMDTLAHRRGWGIAFGVASVATPVALGMCLAGVSSGAIDVAKDSSVVVSSLLAGWCSVFGLVTGVFALCLFLFLSAVYLCWDAAADDEREIRAWFRQRALVMQGVSFVAAAAVAVASAVEAPLLFAQLWSASWALPAQGLVFVLAVAVTTCLITHRYGMARLLAPLQVAVVVVVFGLALDGHLVVPDIAIDDAGARAAIMAPLLPVLLGGMVLVVPSLWLLFRLFKTHR
jgi:cytochrome d ubiquinol oxidase subunit II